MPPSLRGLHHVTALADDPQRNIDFYTRVLGLRLVKVTVDVDDPEAYHVYYGDARGRPGTLLTFYCWPGAIRGSPGTGQVSTTALAIPPGALTAWHRRLSAHDVAVEGPVPRGEGQMLSFRDPDGLALELVAAPTVARWPAPGRGPLPTAEAIRGLYRITLWVEVPEPTEAFLTAALGARRQDAGPDDGLRHYVLGRQGPGTRIAVRATPGVAHCAIGLGSVHHVAVRVPDNAALTVWRARLAPHVAAVGPVQDHVYYRSITVAEPGGVRLEVATEGPGVTVDEGAAEMGTRLALPPWLEHRRAQLTRVLPSLRLPRATPDGDAP
jgi:glyoxalase family protein